MVDRKEQKFLAMSYMQYKEESQASDFQTKYLGKPARRDDIYLSNYQTDVFRTVQPELTPTELLGQGLMGLCGEAGECVDIFKKFLYQGHELDPEHLALELGDVLWYLTVAAKAIGYDLEDIMHMNVRKRRKRYPNGFDSELSQHRKEGDV